MGPNRDRAAVLIGPSESAMKQSENAFQKHKALRLGPEGAVYLATRTVAVVPEVKEGLNHHHTTSHYVLTFFSFWLSSWLSS